MISVIEAKEHLRIEHDLEDGLIEGLIVAATAAVMDHLDQELDPLPAPVRAAILLLVGDLYANRESQADRQLFANETFERLLAPYRKLTA